MAKPTPKQVAQVMELRKERVSFDQIAAQTGLPRGTVSGIVYRHEKNSKPHALRDANEIASVVAPESANESALRDGNETTATQSTAFRDSHKTTVTQSTELRDSHGIATEPLPGTTTKKAGRPTVGTSAMSPRERAAQYRARKKASLATVLDDLPNASDTALLAVLALALKSSDKPTAQSVINQLCERHGIGTI